MKISLSPCIEIRRTFIAFVALFVGVQATSFASTYYISSALGNDANNGTSKLTAWAHHPYMPTFTGTYAHTSGDQFIFRGGDTWGVTNFQMHILVGGSSMNVPDYYGSDQTWFNGTSWTRPKFDFQFTVIGNQLSGAGINVDGTSGKPGPITFDGIELANHRALVGQAFGSASLLIDYWDNVTITNCFIHDWDLSATPSSGQDSASQGGVVLGAGSTTNNRVTHCTIGCSTNVVTMITGACIANIQIVDNTEMYGACQGVLGGGPLIHDCHIHDFPPPTDSGQHCNGIEVFSPSTVYNILMHDLSAYASPIALNPDFITPGIASSNYVYNCVMWNLGGQVAIRLDTGGNPVNSYFYIWNNTIDYPGWAVETVNRGQTNNYAYVEMRNNYFITSQSPAYTFTPPNGAYVSTVVDDHNLTQTSAQATTAGYVIANQFAPTSAGSQTVDTGTTLSAFSTDILGVTRPKLLAWDIGAYEFAGGAFGKNDILSFRRWKLK